MHIVSRDEARLARPIEARLAERKGVRVVGITVHVTAGGADHPIEKWREIQGAAMGGSLPSGDVYGDIPYEDGVAMDGFLLAGRDHRWVGGHARSTGNLANEVTDGLAVIGTGSGLSQAAKVAIRTYVYLWTIEHGRRPLLFDHRDWAALGGTVTACPDPAIASFVDLLRQEARAGH